MGNTSKYVIIWVNENKILLSWHHITDEMKKAKSIEQQIEILSNRGVLISNKEKAKEVLLDIGYYRLGFYFFPYEKSYPCLTNRSHEVREGTLFEDAVSIYYFDFDLRNILNRYLTRVEVAFRTYLTYYMSFKYQEDPFWFVSPIVVRQSFINEFENKVYRSESFKRNVQIKRHHESHPSDRYAPAWKTIEFMTFGSVLKLYKSLDNIDDKRTIAKHFGVGKVVVFESYMTAIHTLRNKCAHGAALFDLTLPNGISLKGPRLDLQGQDCQSLKGALMVLDYVLGHISENRSKELNNELTSLYKRFLKQRPETIEVLKDCSRLIF